MSPTATDGGPWFGTVTSCADAVPVMFANGGVTGPTTFEISDMAGWYLGMASPGHNQIDSNVGGFGWFIDGSVWKTATSWPIKTP